jgi:hypothetical protein
MNLQTYNNSFLAKSNKPYIDFDMDYDTLRDTEDWDVDNDGIDNILDSNTEELVENTRNIINSHKLVTEESDKLSDKILLKYGALTSYRLVSQAFYEDSSPIEPVLKDFYINKLEDKKYTVTFDHPDVLREYLLSKNLLLDLNLDNDPMLPQGKIFFILNGNDEIINMGITLDDNNVGIVLPGEENIQNHSFEGLMMFYADSIAIFQILQ